MYAFMRLICVPCKYGHGTSVIAQQVCVDHFHACVGITYAYHNVCAMVRKHVGHVLLQSNIIVIVNSNITYYVRWDAAYVRSITLVQGWAQWRLPECTDESDGRKPTKLKMGLRQQKFPYWPWIHARLVQFGPVAILLFGAWVSETLERHFCFWDKERG